MFSLPETLYKVKIGYYRTSSGCTGVQLDLNAGSIHCSLCESIHDEMRY